MAKPACKEGGGKMLTCGTSSPLFHSFKASIFSFAKPRTLSAYGYCFCACWPYAVHLAYPVIPWSSSFILLVWIARRVQNFFWFTSFLGDSLFGKHKCSSLNCIHHSHFICKVSPLVIDSSSFKVQASHSFWYLSIKILCKLYLLLQKNFFVL